MRLICDKFPCLTVLYRDAYNVVLEVSQSDGVKLDTCCVETRYVIVIVIVIVRT